MTPITTMTPLGGLKTDVPLVLLPVRLETHFVRAGTATQLLVRIYPDDVHADSHELLLTESEMAWGRHFWVQTWLAGGNTARMRAAWQQLADQFGAPRAAYLADVLRPTNPAARPVTPLDTLTTQPVFPALKPRPEGWPRPPHTRVVPDSWIAIGYAGGQRFTFTGAPIQNPLALGPTLDEKAGGFDAENMAKDPNAAWLVDFAAAERNGMALRVPYPAPYGTPLQRLLVIGVKAGLGSDAGRQLLQDLLRAHRYAGGLAFTPQGTPTNNTGDAGSGYSSLDDGSVAGPLAEAMPATAAFQTGDGSNGDMAARAFGVDASTFAGLEHSTALEQRDAYHMNVALWKATWGYFLEQLMAAPGSPSDAAIREGRLHFSSYVRARGPLPALRIGRQPYGVLPAVSLDRWKSLEGGAIDAPVVRAIAALRDVWRRSLDAIPRIPGRPDPSSELVKALAMHPISGSFAARPTQPLAPLGATAAGEPMGSVAARQLAQSIGVTWSPRQLRAVFAHYQRVLQINNLLVQGPAPEVLSETDALNPNYVTWLLGATWEDIRSEKVAPRPDVLFYLLLRHAALMEYTGTAFRVLLRLQPADAVRESDIADNPLRTVWTQLEKVVASVAPAALGAYLDTVKTKLQNELAASDVAAAGSIWRRGVYDVAASAGVPVDVTDDLREFAAFERSASYLARRPTAALARLVPETLDLASHRLDAWATSFATKRLEWLRQRAPRGVAIGGYGYVEDVVAVERAPVTPPAMPAGELAPEIAAPLYGSAANRGYVLAPSLAHATTAAVLRSGYLSRQMSGEGNVLAVNLSSQRVRTALWLLDGIRQGQSLGTLLGYRFERGLHENHADLILDQYIPSFRALAPQPGDLPTSRQSPGAVESIGVRHVVDGLALLKRYRAGRGPVPSWTAATIPFGSTVPPVATVALPPANPANASFAAIDAELRALDDAVDAISDVTVAEAVHQIAQGNPVRAGAALEAIALGDAPPPELEVIETPRTGIGLTHRLMVLFSGVPAASWSATTPRSQAEPVLGAWASQLLGPGAADALCRVTYVDSSTGAPLLDGAKQPYARNITLRELGLGPLDVVYLPESGRDAQASELEQRIAYRALQESPIGVRPPGLASTADVRLTFTRQADWPAGTLSVAEVLEAARTARRLITSARALTPADLALPDATIPPSAVADLPPVGESADSPERLLRLAFRAETAVGTFRTASQALISAIAAASPQPIAPDTARPLLMGLAAYGVPGTVPLSAAASDPASLSTLHTQTLSAAHEVGERLGRLAALDKAYNATTSTPVETRNYHVARLREVFGQDFLVLPRFAAVDPATLGRTFAATTLLKDSNPLEAVTWLQRAARVRGGAFRLDAALMYAEALGGGAMNLRVGQLPFSGETDRWVGLPGGTLGGRLSLVAHAPMPVDTTRPLAGLMVDEWVEVVPSANETTGLTFHFNRPNARAPQAILLAVTPDERPAWDVETLEATVSETLELAKLRTVDLSALGELGQFLPALYFAEPSSAHTVSSDVTRLSGGGQG